MTDNDRLSPSASPDLPGPLGEACALLAQARMANDSPASWADWWGDVEEFLGAYAPSVRASEDTQEAAAEWSATGPENQGRVTPRGSIPPASADQGKAGGTASRPVANRRPGDSGAGSTPAPSADGKTADAQTDLLRLVKAARYVARNQTTADVHRDELTKALEPFKHVRQYDLDRLGSMYVRDSAESLHISEQTSDRTVHESGADAPPGPVRDAMWQLVNAGRGLVQNILEDDIEARGLLTFDKYLRQAETVMSSLPSHDEASEAWCRRCGSRNAVSWFVNSDQFNLACDALELIHDNAIICPACFVEGYDKATNSETAWEMVLEVQKNVPRDVQLVDVPDQREQGGSGADVSRVVHTDVPSVHDAGDDTWDGRCACGQVLMGEGVVGALHVGVYHRVNEDYCVRASDGHPVRHFEDRSAASASRELLADAIDCIDAIRHNNPTWTDTEIEQTLARLRAAHGTTKDES